MHTAIALTRRAMLASAAAGLMIVATGCATSGRATRPGSSEATILEVDNRNFADMTIFVMSGSQRVRLGTATGKAKSEFRIPASVMGASREVAFLADPVGSNRTALTERIWVTAGERVTLIIPP